MEEKCICGKIIFKNFTRHQSTCGLCKKVKEDFYNSHKNDIMKMYETNSLCIVAEYFQKEWESLGLKSDIYSFILRRFTEEGIHIKTIKESMMLDSTKNKRENFFLENYGVTNASQINFVKEKKRQKAQEVYGCDNVFQSEEIKEKLRNTMLEKYGTLNVTNKNDGRESKPHLKVLEYLKSLGYECESEYAIKCHDENGKVFRTPRVDIYIPKLNLCVEVYGDWCHANPRLYEKEDLIDLWECKKYNRKLYAIEVWVKDEIRLNQIKNEGYNVCVIWEQDINNNDFHSLSRALEFLEKRLDNHNLCGVYSYPIYDLKTMSYIYDDEGNLEFKFDEDLDFVVA